MIQKNQKGISILIALIVLGALTATAAGVASVFTKEIRISSFIDDSVFAIMATDAGVERKLYEIRRLGEGAATPFTKTLSNGASYSICAPGAPCTDGPPVVIQITGEFNNIRRSFEVSF